MDTTINTDLVVLDDADATDDSDNSSSSNLPAIGVALVAGAVLGKFVVPAVVGFIRGRRKTPSFNEDAEIMTIITSNETHEETAV